MKEENFKFKSISQQSQWLFVAFHKWIINTKIEMFQYPWFQENSSEALTQY